MPRRTIDGGAFRNYTDYSVSIGAMAPGARTPTKSSAETSSRSAILRAATEEFALKGYAGARTDGIAHAAGVKHTLLFYHFKKKEQLYGAVLETVFSDWAERVTRVLDERATPKQRLLAFVNAYFDFVAEFPFAPRLVQQEQLRQRAAGSEHLLRLAEQYIQPVHRKLVALLREGICSGEFRELNIEHCIHSLSALIIFYFTSDLTAHLLGVVEPCSPPNIAARREAVLEFVSAALFTSGSVRK
jgi:AcrR family transcriptional regulator